MARRNQRTQKSKKVRTDLKCPVCGEIFPIWRLRRRQHKVGHIKDLYCPHCKDDRKFIEVKYEMKTLDGSFISELYN